MCEIICDSLVSSSWIRDESEAARVHRASRWSGGCVAARGALAAPAKPPIVGFRAQARLPPGEIGSLPSWRACTSTVGLRAWWVAQSRLLAARSVAPHNPPEVVTGFGCRPPSLSSPQASRSPGRRSKAAGEGKRERVGDPVSGRYGDLADAVGAASAWCNRQRCGGRAPTPVSAQSGIKFAFLLAVARPLPSPRRVIGSSPIVAGHQTAAQWFCSDDDALLISGPACWDAGRPEADHHNCRPRAWTWRL